MSVGSKAMLLVLIQCHSIAQNLATSTSVPSLHDVHKSNIFKENRVCSSSVRSHGSSENKLMNSCQY
jgi:hypothetical protein